MALAYLPNCPKCDTELTNDDVSSDYDTDGEIVHTVLCSNENCDFSKEVSAFMEDNN